MEFEMISFDKRMRGIALLMGFASLLMTQAQAAPASSGDLTAGQRAELQHDAGIRCDRKSKENCTAGNLESGDFYDVRIYGDCTIAAYYGRIAEKAASLRTVVATTGSDGKTQAVLAPEQLVCIKAAAQVQSSDKEYYVIALPMDHGPECKGEDLCRKPQPLAEPFQSAMKNCRPDTKQGLKGCPQGWVFATEMEAYPNGLPQAQ
ncbi:hypothetical protein [Brucella pseudogrignonensis]|uniref:hypothetical protein n=1 Tax=Brucella pseudogrignonensis TaxID=419475 RepID=UPI001AD83E98|nr:hypothetical protein [Brucella pseudogrignonensis]